MNKDNDPNSHPPAAMAPETANKEPGRARALFSTADFRLLRAALTSHARQTDDKQELAKINALHHRLGNYVPDAE